MSRWKLVSCSLLGLVLLHPSSALPQIARVELHTFASTTLTEQEFLTGKKEGKPIVLAGELRIPTSGTDRLPAVILVHGSGGIGRNVDDWAKKLNELGVATFAFDSFTPRGIVSTVTDQTQLSGLAMIVDTYRALELLAKHPRIAPDRIAVMGFSKGGGTALYSGLKRFQRLHGPSGASFALYIAFYPPCYTTYLDDNDVSDRPFRIYHGAADDWVPVAPCRAYVERLSKAGKDVRLTEYAGAYHAFDNASRSGPIKVPQAVTVRSCRLEEASPGRLINSETKQPFTYQDSCVERGANAGLNPDAYAQVVDAVTGVVNITLKGK